MTTELVALGIFLLLVGMGARVVLKSLGRRFVGLDQQLRELTRQISAQHHRTDDLSRQIDSQNQRIEQLSAQIDAQQHSLSALTENFNLAPLIDPSEFHMLAANAAEASQRLAALAESVEHLKTSHPPVETFPIDPEFLRARTESEMIALAESLPALRPLLPYPHWRFDIDWNNPDPAFRARRQIWQAFHDRAIETPVTIRWHFGTQLHLYLGNDASRQIYVAGCIDPNEFAFLYRFIQPGMMVVDGGANEGTYTIFASARVGTSGAVWAFEPSGRELDRLRSNLVLNNLSGDSPSDSNESRVRIFTIALADCNGYLDFTLAQPEHAGQNTLGDFASPAVEASGHQTIPVRRLDDVIAEHPLDRIDLLKLDVEGAELRALNGATATLRRYRPVILLEVSEGSLGHQGASREGLIAFLRAHDYSLYRFHSSGIPVRAEPGEYSDNMIAVPEGTTLPAAVFQT